MFYLFIFYFYIYLRRWKEYFEELLNEENEREHRKEEPEIIRERIDQVRKDEEKL